ncbi:hypothetical protein WA026_006244 [Henosepilachna vigintioctopunctata]|uniref:Uncharacterized protein n=1 Tax=Henosepilachna vigintioctopunctata TaxID=420089 RepID=A0AAW1TQV5_9CUCU
MSSKRNGSVMENATTAQFDGSFGGQITPLSISARRALRPYCLVIHHVTVTSYCCRNPYSRPRLLCRSSRLCCAGLMACLDIRPTAVIKSGCRRCRLRFRLYISSCFWYRFSSFPLALLGVPPGVGLGLLNKTPLEETVPNNRSSNSNSHHLQVISSKHLCLPLLLVACA